ncbi:acyl-CoA dehydrogenase family protein [Streptosporangium sp. NPDC000239]|uniref:acyl-CoA dehydrogenase family protein n=1 Tax=Streptosporangium sp. NPDC000239 TaxID=3154248 RepID=UPI003329C7E7
MNASRAAAPAGSPVDDLAPAGLRARVTECLRECASDRAEPVVAALDAAGLCFPGLPDRVVLAESLAAALDFDPAAEVLARHDRPGAGAGLPVAALQVAASARLVATTGGWLGTRHSFGQRLIDHQVVRFRLAELMAYAEGARHLVHAATADTAAGARGDGVVEAARLQARKLLRRTARVCLHLHGASGYVAGHPAQRLLLAGHRPADGISDEQLLDAVARHLRGADD